MRTLIEAPDVLGFLVLVAFRLIGFDLAELSGRTFRAPLPEDMRSFAAEWGWDDRDLD